MLLLTPDPAPALAAQTEAPPLVLRGDAASVVRGPFAPMLDVPYRQRIEQVRSVAGETSRYVAERTARFSREPSGFRAELMLVLVDGGIGSPAGAMFEAGLRGLWQRPLVFHLDAGGRILRLENAASHWAAYLDGLVGQPFSGPSAQERRARLIELTAPMRALAPQRQVEFLASALNQIIDTAAGSRLTPAPTPVTRSVRSPLGGNATLVGTVRRSRDASGFIIEEEVVAGVLAATRADANGEMQVRETRRIDEATGLVMSQERRERIVIPGGETIITTRTTLQPELAR